MLLLVLGTIDYCSVLLFIVDFVVVEKWFAISMETEKGLVLRFSIISSKYDFLVFN